MTTPSGYYSGLRNCTSFFNCGTEAGSAAAGTALAVEGGIGTVRLGGSLVSRVDNFLTPTVPKPDIRTVFAGAAESGVLDGANFAQKTFKSTFSAEGKFAGRAVSDVAADLRAGRLAPNQVPIEYIVRDGNTLILNTRSAQALEQAGIPRNQWNAVNVTGNAQAEARLTGQLTRNRLTSQGTPTVRPSNGN